jgi:hypothetical protein
MALQDTLSGFTKKSPAAQNRIAALLLKLSKEAPEDYDTLEAALRNSSVRPVALTRALKQEYGSDVVTDSSVSDWRSRHFSELTGL